MPVRGPAYGFLMTESNESADARAAHKRLPRSLYVERITIRNFRGIDDLTVTFEPGLTVLVGRNNSGKTRVLRALAVALGGRPAELDDLTVGATGNAEIDLVVAPWPPPASPSDEDLFADDLVQRLVPAAIQEAPERQRFAWRTTIKPSREGFGAVGTFLVLQFSPTEDWYLRERAAALSHAQRTVLDAMLIDTRRDLAEELTTRGSGIRKVLSDLEIEDDEREALETKLGNLGDEIVASSAALSAVTTSLADAEQRVGGLGRPVVNPLPPRLEELARSVSIDLDTGSGALPMRLHGSGPRGLASLQVQRVLYERRLGVDGPARHPHPVSLVEEPEAHLHPQLQFELPALLEALPGQVVASTHSSHLVTAVDPACLRLLRDDDGHVSIRDIKPADDDDSTSDRARKPTLHRVEMETMKRFIERPFGELLFASGVVIGDGATERAFLPPLLRHALGGRRPGVCVVDPSSMKQPMAGIVVKFAKLVEMPWYLFADGDEDGREAVAAILKPGDVEADRVAWVTGPNGADATESMMWEFDEAVCTAACEIMRRGEVDRVGCLKAMTDLKGSIGTVLAGVLIESYPDPAGWPDPLRTLVEQVDSGR